MQKRSISARAADSGGAAQAGEALRSLTAIVLELQAAMQQLRANLPTSAGTGPQPQGTLPDLPEETQSAFDAAESIARNQPRGSGAQLAAVYRAELESVAQLPGGLDSPLYSELQKKLRDAQSQSFKQDTDAEYNTPAARLDAALERSRLLPSGSANRSSLEQQKLQLDAYERNRLARYEAERRESGELSEAEELDLTRKQEALLTDEAHTVSGMAHGMEDLLPALSANRPASFTAFDSVQLANLRNGGHPIVGAEAYPMPQHQGFDAMGQQRLAEAIGRLADAILHGAGRSGSALHPGESTGSLNGLLSTTRFGNRPDGYN